MTKRTASVTQAEIERSLKGVQAAGIAVGRVEVDHNARKVVIFPVGVPLAQENPCDRLLK
jgi:hypothetical protein